MERQAPRRRGIRQEKLPLGLVECKASNNRKLFQKPEVIIMSIDSAAANSIQEMNHLPNLSYAGRLVQPLLLY